MTLSELIKQPHFSSPVQEAMLNILVTSSWLQNELAVAAGPYDITLAQYNVLRILRGSHPHAMMCSDIGDRLLDRTPDVTRLLNRMEARGWVQRTRAGYDRRVVEVQITEKGLALLGEMKDVIETTQNRLMQHLSDEELRILSLMLDRLRTDQVV
jgi:DNA-binding MarR family transcriptional regulator